MTILETIKSWFTTNEPLPNIEPLFESSPTPGIPFPTVLTGKVWEKDEETLASQLFEYGSEIAYIAGVLNRSDASVRTKLIKLGYSTASNSSRTKTIK